MQPAKAALLAATLLIALPFSGGAADQRTLTGNFMSGFQDRVKPLRAVFTPAEENRWDVKFYFKFNGRDHEYTGTAEGTLGAGELKGVVKNESGQRTFTFTGSFKGKNFKGTHAEIRRNGETKTGSLMLKLS